MNNRIFFDKTKNINLSIENFKGHLAPVDASNRFWRQTYGLFVKKLTNDIKKYNNPLTIVSIYLDHTKHNFHIEAAFNFAISQIKHGMLPIYIFDGKSPKEKKDTIEKRKNLKQIFVTKCEELVNNNTEINEKNIYNNIKKTFNLSKVQLNECKKAIQLMGICCIDAMEEADQQCAAFSKYYKEHVIGTISDDFDIVIHGGDILQGFSFKSEIQHISLKNVLDTLLSKANEILKENNLVELTEFTHQHFVDFAVLQGTDYTCNNKLFKLHGISSDELFKIYVLSKFDKELIYDKLRENTTLEQTEFIDMWKKISNMYLHPNVINPKSINFRLQGIKVNELIKFICDEKGMDKNYVIKELKKIKKNYDSLRISY